MFSTRENPDFENLTAMIKSESIDPDKRRDLEIYKNALQKDGTVSIYHDSDGGGRYRSYINAKGGKTIKKTGATFPKDIRAALFGGKYDDLDMVNTAGSIMYQLFCKEGHSVPVIERYYESRERVLEEIMEFYNPQLERESAKTMVLEVFFGGDGRQELDRVFGPAEEGKHDLPEFLIELKKEYRSSIAVIMDECEYDYNHKYYNVYAKTSRKCAEKGKKLWYGSFASYLCQSIERKILDIVIREINEVASSKVVFDPIGSLVHDGLHVKKALGIEEHINRIQDEIHSSTGYLITLAVKPMDSRKLVVGVETSYQSLKEEFEKTRFKVRRGRHPFYTIYPADNEIIAYNIKDFSVLNRDWIPTGGHKFLQRWLDDGTKRTYDYVEYSCTRDEDKKPNIYYAAPELRFKTLTSTSSEVEKQYHIDFLNNYIKLLAEDNDDTAKWLTLWLADILINPHTKGAQPVAVVLFGKQGLGKTSFREMVSVILGEKMVHNTNNPTGNGDVLHTDFNAALKHKLFIEFEEINMKTHSKVVDSVKALITDNVHLIKNKGHDPVSVKATERYLFTTNNPDSIVVEQSDRRYCTLSVSQRRLGDRVYWNEFYDLLKSTNFVKDVADYLCSFKDELTDYPLGTNRPMTKHYERLKELSFPPELEFLKDMYFESEGAEVSAGVTELSQKYNAWREKHSIEGKVSTKKFSMVMSTHGEKYGISSKRMTSGNVLIIATEPFRQQISKDMGIEVEQVAEV